MRRRILNREDLQADAARLLAEDELSDEEIARHCGITRRTLMRWKEQPAIQQEIDEHLKLIEMQSEVRMLSERQDRIADMAMRLEDLQHIVRQRAKSPEMRDVPGGRTGLMRRRKSSFGRRRQTTGLDPTCDYEVDITLLREERRLLRGIAKALGQWGRPKYEPIPDPTSTAVSSGKQHQAALLIADGTRSDLEIASACGINRRTLARWKEQPSFSTRVAEARTTVFGSS